MAGVSETSSFSTHTADGATTVFNFSFFVYSADDIKVYSVLNDVETEITAGFTKTVNSSNIGGNVTFTTAPQVAVGDILIRREVPYTQTTEFADLTRFKETAIESALNTLALQIQQLNSDSGLSLRYNETASITDRTIGAPVNGNLLVFDGTTGRIKGAAPSTINVDDLDTLLSGLATNDVLVYNGTAFANQSLDTFKTLIGLKKNNYAATAAPTVNDDSGDGYSIGSQWYDGTNDDMYHCMDATAGAAVWVQGDVVAADLGSAAVAALISSDTFSGATTSNINAATSTKNYIDNQITDLQVKHRFKAVNNGSTVAITNIYGESGVTGARNSNGDITITLPTAITTASMFPKITIIESGSSIQPEVTIDSTTEFTIVTKTTGGSGLDRDMLIEVTGIYV